MHEKELEILEHLHQDTSLHQRDLSRIVGLSLGMTNAILKRLATKGFLMVRKVNNRNIKYIVSPAGVEEISRRSYNYLKRTIKNIVYYKENLEHTLRQLKEQGIQRVLLEGQSDVDFIIEHLCMKTGLHYSRCPAGYKPGQEEIVLVSENEEPYFPALGSFEERQRTDPSVDAGPFPSYSASDSGSTRPVSIHPGPGITERPGNTEELRDTERTGITEGPGKTEGVGNTERTGNTEPNGKRLYLRNLLIRT